MMVLLIYELSMFEKIADKYCEYVKMTPKQKLQAGELLAKAGRELLEVDKAELNLDERLERSYLIKKIAEDLSKQALDMAYTKQFDCSPKLKEYNLLAYELAYEYSDRRANRRLIPYLSSIKSYGDYSSIFQESLALEEEYFKIVSNNNF